MYWTKEKARRIADEKHKKFVDLMYPEFGLNTHPGYSTIIAKPLLMLGTSCDKKIYLDDMVSEESEIGKQDFLEFLFTIRHESAHTIDPRIYKGIKRKKPKSLGEHFLVEIIADYACVLFYNKYDAQNILPKSKNNSLAVRLFKRDEKLLKILVNTKLRESKLILSNLLNQNISNKYISSVMSMNSLIA